MPTKGKNHQIRHMHIILQGMVPILNWVLATFVECPK